MFAVDNVFNLIALVLMHTNILYFLHACLKHNIFGRKASKVIIIIILVLHYYINTSLHPSTFLSQLLCVVL